MTIMADKIDKKSLIPDIKSYVTELVKKNDSVTPKKVRLEFEKRQGLEPGSLKALKEFFKEIAIERLNEINEKEYKAPIVKSTELKVEYTPKDKESKVKTTKTKKSSKKRKKIVEDDDDEGIVDDDYISVEEHSDEEEFSPKKKVKISYKAGSELETVSKLCKACGLGGAKKGETNDQTLKRLKGMLEKWKVPIDSSLLNKSNKKALKKHRVRIDNLKELADLDPSNIITEPRRRGRVSYKVDYGSEDENDENDDEDSEFEDVGDGNDSD